MLDPKVQMIKNYLQAYNTFDVEGMVNDLDDAVVFENYSDGELTLQLEGKEAFKRQAESAASYFKERQQKVVDWQIEEDVVTIEIDYFAMLNTNFPNGMKAGDTLQLKGKSVFKFRGGKIVLIQDFS